MYYDALKQAIFLLNVSSSGACPHRVIGLHVNILGVIFLITMWTDVWGFVQQKVNAVCTL